MRHDFGFRVLGSMLICWFFLLMTPELRADDLLRSVQKRLAASGYYKGKVDGLPGSMTNAAIRRFQLANNLKVTGELNHQTLAKLGLNGGAPAPDYSAIGRLFSNGPLARAEVNEQVEAIDWSNTDQTKETFLELGEPTYETENGVVYESDTYSLRLFVGEDDSTRIRLTKLNQ